VASAAPDSVRKRRRVVIDFPLGIAGEHDANAPAFCWKCFAQRLSLREKSPFQQEC
jgi:hypothetical protein